MEPRRASGFEWDDSNLEHLAEHGIDDWEVEAIFDNRPIWVFNKRDRAGDYKMIGRTFAVPAAEGAMTTGRARSKSEEAELAAFYQAHKDDPDLWGDPLPDDDAIRPESGLGAIITVRFASNEMLAMRTFAKASGLSYLAIVRDAVKAYLQPTENAARTSAPMDRSEVELGERIVDVSRSVHPGIVVSARFDAQEAQALFALAAAEGKTLSQIAREALLARLHHGAK